jgi:hypothetical protein
MPSLTLLNQLAKSRCCRDDQKLAEAADELERLKWFLWRFR